MTKPTNYRPHFDAAAMEAANVEPTIQIGSYVYTGRLLSAPEWFVWNERVQQLKARVEAGEAKGFEILAFYHSFFRTLFPRGLFRPGVPFWAPDVADSLIQEPLGAIEEAFAIFFARQAHANGVSAKSPSTTPGRLSKSSTPEAVAAGS